jgi:hypothetical protein
MSPPTKHDPGQPVVLHRQTLDRSLDHAHPEGRSAAIR